MLQTNGGHLQGFLWVIFSEPREFRLPGIDSLLWLSRIYRVFNGELSGTGVGSLGNNDGDGYENVT